MPRTESLKFKEVQRDQLRALKPPKKKFNEKKAVRQKVSIRIHRMTIKAIDLAAANADTTFSKFLRECLAIGMKKKGIEYVD